jgi:tartrate dehydrogenase/decarboxylase/D-malate dehydrogenase
MAHQIAVIPGDGIGPEVVDATLPLLEAVEGEFDTSFEFTRYDWSTERYLETGEMMPDGGIDTLREFDAILLGAVGRPDVPDHVTLRGLLLPIRKGLNQGICKRPSYLFDGVESPLVGYDGGDIDFVVFRENTEGEYADVGGREHRGSDSEVAIQSAVFTREATERIVRAAFDAARERDGQLASITKSNAQAYSMVLWDEVVEDVATEYPSVEVERLLVDAASMDAIRRPGEFDVVVASNLFGDIFTDIGAIITGSMGLAPSANVDPSGENPAMFEPVHGSALDIAGRGVANPLATALSGAMMCEYLGDGDAGDAIRTAVSDQLSDDDAPRTPDIDGSSTTAEVRDDLLGRLEH